MLETRMFSRGVRIVSENGIANQVVVTTENGTELTGITSIEIMPMQKDSILKARITVLVSEIDLFAREVEAQPTSKGE